MNEQKWLFIGTDDRMAACSKIMAKKGFDSHHIATDHCSAQLEQCLREIAPQHIVFPVLQLKGTFPVTALHKDTVLYTGVASEEWLAPFKEEGFTIRRYLKDEPFIWQNARLTAEGFIREYYAYAGRSIAEKQFHVAGFGRVGKTAAHALASLGAKVTIVARSDSQLGEAAVLGYPTERLTDDWKITEGNLINTIPAKWLSFSGTPDLHIFDLASAPGCLKEVPVSEYYIILLGLPGKHFPVDAATALADTLERMYIADERGT